MSVPIHEVKKYCFIFIVGINERINTTTQLDSYTLPPPTSGGVHYNGFYIFLAWVDSR